MERASLECTEAGLLQRRVREHRRVSGRGGESVSARRLEVMSHVGISRESETGEAAAESGGGRR
jgi:hypothetical protein